MFDDIFKSVRRHMSDRLASPLMGSFIVCWLVWNYKFVLIALSTAPVADRLSLIGREVFPDTGATWLNGVLIPLGGALVYVLVYPMPARWTYHYAKWQQGKLLAIRRKLEDETPLTREESRKVRNAAQTRIDGLQKVVDRLIGENASLRAELASAASAAAAVKEPKESNPPRQTEVPAGLSDAELYILRIVEEARGYPRGDLANATGMNHTLAEFSIEDLHNRNLLKVEASPDTGELEWLLTQLGRKALLENHGREIDLRALGIGPEE